MQKLGFPNNFPAYKLGFIDNEIVLQPTLQFLLIQTGYSQMFSLDFSGFGNTLFPLRMILNFDTNHTKSYQKTIGGALFRTRPKNALQCTANFTGNQKFTIIVMGSFLQRL